jgi:peptide chain release factor 1
LISVAVLPVPPADPRTQVPLSDLEITAQTGKQGAGGQNVNKVASAIRCVYRPDPSIRVFINGRDQHKNKAEAIKVINARVQEKRRQQQNAAYAAVRRDALGTGGRGAKVRTYNFIEGRVTDHRLGVKTRHIEVVMRGRFGLLFESKDDDG